MCAETIYVYWCFCKRTKEGIADQKSYITMEGTRRRSKLLHHLALYILCAQGMIAYREAVVLHQGDSAFIWKTRSFAQRAGIHLFTNMAVPSYFEEYRKMVRKRVNDIKRGSELTGIRSREEDLLVKLTDYPQETSWINGVFCEFPSYHRETIIHQIGDIPFVPVDKISKIFVKPLWNIPVPTMAYNQDLKETVERISRNGRIILSVSDKSYTSMTQNFIETSIRPFNFTNHLVVGLSSNFCESLNSSISACFEFNRHHKGGNFGSAEFANLVNVKTEAMLAILLLGYDVLLADVDIVFLRDPLNDLVREEYEQYDLLIQDDLHSPNSGFMLLRSNSVGVTFAGKNYEHERNLYQIDNLQRCCDRRSTSTKQLWYLFFKTPTNRHGSCNSEYETIPSKDEGMIWTRFQT